MEELQWLHDYYTREGLEMLDGMYGERFDEYRKAQHADPEGQKTVKVKSLADAFRKAPRFKTGPRAGRRDFRPIRVLSARGVGKSRGWRRMSLEEVSILRYVETSRRGKAVAARSEELARRELERQKTATRKEREHGRDLLQEEIDAVARAQQYKVQLS